MFRENRPIPIPKTKSNQDLDEIKIINEEQAELQYFKTRYPEEFYEALKSVEQQNDLPLDGLFSMANEAKAVEILKG